jgi:hypothetical protein
MLHKFRFWKFGHLCFVVALLCGFSVASLCAFCVSEHHGDSHARLTDSQHMFPPVKLTQGLPAQPAKFDKGSVAENGAEMVSGSPRVG